MTEIQEIKNQKRKTRDQTPLFINLTGTLFARYLVPFIPPLTVIECVNSISKLYGALNHNPPILLME